MDKKKGKNKRRGLMPKADNYVDSPDDIEIGEAITPNKKTRKEDVSKKKKKRK